MVYSRHQSTWRRAMTNNIARHLICRHPLSPLRCISLDPGVRLQKSSNKLLSSASSFQALPFSFMTGELSSPVLNRALMLPRSMEDATRYVGRANQDGKGGRHEFYDHSLRRCALCDAKLDWSYAAHTTTVEHQGRLGILERSIALLDTFFTHLLGPKSDSKNVKQFSTDPGESGSTLLFTHDLDGHKLPTPEDFGRNPDLLKSIDWVDLLVQRWWKMLNPNHAGGTCSFDFQRIPSMSADNPRQRLWRIRFLLRLLMNKGILRDSLPSLLKLSFARTNRFERCEMIGDNLIKSVFHDRLHVLFPPTEGGISKGLSSIQQMLDSNGGLIALYDYLKLDELIRSHLANNKTKADVVESLFGELQTFLWASETRYGIDFYPALPNDNFACLRAIVSHVFHELAHVAVMWRVEDTLRISKPFITAYLDNKWTRLEDNVASKGVANKGGNHAIQREQVFDRHTYAPLPLLTLHRRQHPRFRQAGKEAWSYSVYVAPTRAGSQHEYHRQVWPAPIPKPPSMCSHYRRNALRVRCAKQGSKPSAVRRSLTQLSPSEIPPEPSLGAALYPSWRRHEECTRARQAMSDAAEVFQLTEEGLSGLMMEKIKHFIPPLLAAVDSMNADKGYPDFSNKPHRQDVELQRWTLAEVLKCADR